MRGYVGVTDDEWYRFLAARPEVSQAEVNFWRPGGGREFRALTVGEPFFFKTHSPHNRVVGGGFFSGFAALRTSEAWPMFGEANGASSLGRMRERIARYRREPIGPGDDPEIGCVFVRNVAFFPGRRACDPPPGFASNIVQGKSYDLADRQVSGYFGDLMQLVLGVDIEIDFSQPWHAAGPVFGDPRLAPYRLAQQAFKAVVLSAYHGHCAITGNKMQPTFARYLAVDTSHRLLVSPRLRSDFGNGERFYAKAGQVIMLPDRKADRPQQDFLRWHLDTVFKAS